MNENETLPTISVIIPCYNCTKWIERCLSALERQTYKNFEVICVDDCSSDDTYDMILNYQEHNDLNIKLIKNTINSGPAISRNKAAECAEGQWLAFCDSDDYYESTYLEEMIGATEKDNSDLVMCEYRKVYESGKKSEDIHYLSGIDKFSPKEDIIVYSKASLCLILLKKSIFVKNFIPNLRNGEDIASVPCLEINAKKLSVIKKPLYNYFIRKISASNRPSLQVYKSLLLAFKHIESNFSSNYEVLEYLGIKTVVYGVTINAFKANVSINEVKEIIEQFSKDYPNWRKNKYNFTFSKLKLLYIKMIGKKFYCICKILAKIHARLST